MGSPLIWQARVKKFYAGLNDTPAIFWEMSKIYLSLIGPNRGGGFFSKRMSKRMCSSSRRASVDRVASPGPWGPAVHERLLAPSPTTRPPHAPAAERRTAEPAPPGGRGERASRGVDAGPPTVYVTGPPPPRGPPSSISDTNVPSTADNEKTIKRQTSTPPPTTV